jgi:hypothetical protein
MVVDKADYPELFEFDSRQHLVQWLLLADLGLSAGPIPTHCRHSIYLFREQILSATVDQCPYLCAAARDLQKQQLAQHPY